MCIALDVPKSYQQYLVRKQLDLSILQFLLGAVVSLLLAAAVGQPHLAVLGCGIAAMPIATALTLLIPINSSWVYLISDQDIRLANASHLVPHTRDERSFHAQYIHHLHSYYQSYPLRSDWKSHDIVFVGQAHWRGLPSISIWVCNKGEVVKAAARTEQLLIVYNLSDESKVSLEVVPLLQRHKSIT